MPKTVPSDVRCMLFKMLSAYDEEKSRFQCYEMEKMHALEMMSVLVGRNVMREIPERSPWPFKFDRPSGLNSDTSLIDLSESSSDMQSNLNYEGSQRIHDIMDENKYPNRIQHRKKVASRIYYRGRELPAYDGLPYVPDNNVLI